MIKLHKRLIAVVGAGLAAGAALLPGAASAADSPVTVQIEGGYAGVVPRGGWAPVQVNVTNHGPDTKATLRFSITGSQNGFGGPGFFKGVPIPMMSPGGVFVGPGVPVASPSPGGTGGGVTQQLDVVLPAGTGKHFIAYLPSDPGTWKAEVVSASGKSLAAAETQVTQAITSLTIAVVSDDHNALNQIGSIATLSQTFQGQPQLVHLAPASLPDSPAALSSFGLVAITNATTDGFTATQRHALDDYVAQGGSVLVTGGAAWRTTQAGVPPDLVPFAATAVQGVPGLPAVSSALGNAAVPGSVDVATGTRRAGITDLGEGQTPIIVEATLGRGRIFYSAVDLSAEPLASWSGTLPLLRQLIVRAAGDTAQGFLPGPFTASGHGVRAQGSSLFQALSNIPSLDLPSPLLIALALIVFIVLVGPVNYVLLHRIRRPDLAWGTIPLLVVLSTGSIYGIGLKTRGTDVLADRIRVVHLQAGSSRAYVDAGTGVFAPHTGTHTVSATPGSLVTTLTGAAQFILGGGIAIPLPVPFTGATGSLTILGTNPPDVRMTWPNADSIQVFGEEYAETEPGTIETHVAVANGRLTGTVVNHLPTTITDAVVISGNAFSTFGAIRPGASVTVDIPVPNAAGAVVLNGPAASLPQQIYLHAPASCGQNGPCIIPGVTPQSRPTARQREAQRRSDVLSGVLGQDAFDLQEPMFVAWGATPTGAVRVDGHKAQLNELDALVLPLQPEGAGATLAAGTITSRLVDTTGFVPAPGLGNAILRGFLPPNSSTTLEFVLGPGTWQQVSLSESALPPMPGAPGFGPPTFSVFNFRTSAWDTIILGPGSTHALPGPADHVSPDGALRVRVGNGNGPAQMGALDVSATRTAA